MSLIGCLTNIVGSSPIYLMHISCRCFQICIYLNSPRLAFVFFSIFANFYRYLDGLHIHVYLHSYLRFYSHLFRDYIYILHIDIIDRSIESEREREREVFTRHGILSFDP